MEVKLWGKALKILNSVNLSHFTFKRKSDCLLLEHAWYQSSEIVWASVASKWSITNLTGQWQWSRSNRLQQKPISPGPLWMSLTASMDTMASFLEDLWLSA